MKLLAVVLLAVVMMTGAPAASYAQDASDQLNRWRQAAGQGDAEAEINLGNTYRDGDGVKKDDDEAAKWYRKAADHGIADAQFNLGLAYATGRGVAQDYKEAVKWYTKAAEQGNLSAQDSLGDACMLGAGVDQDKKQAVSWYQKAAEQGYPDAEYKLGEAYHKGAGIQRDDKEAITWYRKAAERGSAPASARLMEIEQQSGILHMKYVPGALLLSAFMASMIALISFIIQTRKEGTEHYELNFFVSAQFGLLVLGALIFYATGIFSQSCSGYNQGTGTCDESGMGIAQWISLGTAAVALMMNVKQSNASFGVLYTLAQAITAYSIFLAFIIEIFKKPKKSKKALT